MFFVANCSRNRHRSSILRKWICRTTNIQKADGMSIQPSMPAEMLCNLQLIGLFQDANLGSVLGIWICLELRDRAKDAQHLVCSLLLVIWSIFACFYHHDSCFSLMIHVCYTPSFPCRLRVAKISKIIQSYCMPNFIWLVSWKFGKNGWRMLGHLILCIILIILVA